MKYHIFVFVDLVPHLLVYICRVVKQLGLCLIKISSNLNAKQVAACANFFTPNGCVYMLSL